MTSTNIQEVLDGLDRRLALGEIDLPLYQTLRTKFSAQVSAPAPLESALAAMPMEAAAIKCPGCLAPLAIPAGQTTGMVQCEFCQGSFAVQTAADEMERLRGDVKRWISETVGKTSAGARDEASRVFIFRNSLWPPLQTSANRTVELYQPTRFLPFFTFPLLDRLHRSPFRDALDLTPNLDHLVGRLKGVVGQIQSPELGVFAATPSERNDIHLLEVSCLELIHLSNARHGLAEYSTEGFAATSANLRALDEMYTAARSTAREHVPSLDLFYGALQKRLNAVGEASRQLAELLKESDGVVIDPIIAALDRQAESCLVAASDIEISGREPRDIVPAAEGARNDAEVISMLADCCRIFAESGAAECGIAFGIFLDSLATMVEAAAPSQPDIIWMKGFLDNLARYLGALDGSVQVPTVDDFQWAESSAAAGATASFFAGKETFNIEERYLVPFWVAAIHFSEQTGAWFWKKGQSVAGFLYMDASRHGGLCFIEADGSPLAVQTVKALETPISGPSTTAVLVPLTSSDAANRGMRASLNASQRFRGCHFKIVGLVYLPAAKIKYTNKKSERFEALLPGTERHPVTLAPREFKLGSRQTWLAC